MGCKFLDQNGREKPVIMGSYGIGSGRMLACVAEQFNDEAGLMWPISVAPYQVHMVMLAGADPESQVAQTANQLYEELTSAGVEVLFDDRKESPGVKFKDADLMGMPIRLTVGKKSLDKGGVELKLRTEKDASFTQLADCVKAVTSLITELEQALTAGVKPVAFPD